MWAVSTTCMGSVLLGWKPYQPNHKKKNDELFLLLSNTSVEPHFAKAHHGDVAERTHSPQRHEGVQGFTVIKTGRSGNAYSNTAFLVLLTRRGKHVLEDGLNEARTVGPGAQ